MIVVSHSSSRGLLIFVAYLEKGKVLLGLKFLKCVCIQLWAYNMWPSMGKWTKTYWDFLQAKFEKKIDL